MKVHTKGKEETTYVELTGNHKSSSVPQAMRSQHVVTCNINLKIAAMSV